MEELWIRFAENMSDRISGPMKFRLLLQPIMALAFAVIDGMKDAKENRSPYVWGLLSDPGHRGERVRDGWKSIGKVFVLALLLDAVYQFVVARFVYPGEAVFVAIVLALVPYVLVRGLATRLLR